MELSWSDNATLKFSVHLKLNQQLKYLNAGSAHTPGCFKAIKTGVCYRLTKLTTVDEDSVDLKLDEIYPEHFDTLNKANLLKDFEARTYSGSQDGGTRSGVERRSRTSHEEKERERQEEGNLSLRLDSATTGEPRSTRRFVKSSRGSHP
jgi:hypothetical protein